MKRTGLLVVLVLIYVATRLAIRGDFLFMPGVVEPPVADGPMVAVVVSKVDIPPGTDLDQLIENDQLRLIEVSQEAVVDGAVTSIDQLSGKTNTLAILAGEQILAGRLKNAAEQGSSGLGR
jgi:Flp pilus assembly protein CpaB